MTATTLIIDCDPGVDDAIALVLALASPELDLAAVTTIAGNRPLDIVTANACGLMALAGRADVPVHAGCRRGLLPREVRWSYAHGDDGLGGVPLPAARPAPAAGHAADALVERIMAAPPQSVVLAAIGPLTNVALAFAKAATAAGPGAEDAACRCWVFTPLSFLNVLEELSRARQFAFVISQFAATEPGASEFFVCLRRDHVSEPARLLHRQEVAINHVRAIALERQRRARLLGGD